VLAAISSAPPSPGAGAAPGPGKPPADPNFHPTPVVDAHCDVTERCSTTLLSAREHRSGTSTPRLREGHRFRVLSVSSIPESVDLTRFFPHRDCSRSSFAEDGPTERRELRHGRNAREVRENAASGSTSMLIRR